MAKNKPAQAAEGGEKKATSAKGNGTVFIVAALDMSWRLAIVVLIPIIGGYELDNYLGTMPALTIVGFLLAMAGLYLILKRTLAMADDKFKTGMRR